MPALHLLSHKIISFCSKFNKAINIKLDGMPNIKTRLKESISLTE